uniref:NADH dehydrogenase subunit 2 n=1 Tax=Cyrtorhinus lividipennis TaxID=1032904 RepID=UPI002114092A|nr:NADH dehydrogenase subunit 2 [Cyrtorhinus lividipennis]USH90816.1 NADH dehydrogenase subunit 2 [Cyrtorhinus lividipennis]
MKTSSKSLFLTMTIISTMMVLSSSNWMNMWVGLEINLLSFIPMMSEGKNPYKSQGTMMYFLVQSMASSIMIMTIMMSKFIMMSKEMSITNNIIVMSMMMKLGMPPFHLWFPEIMNKMNWNMCFLLSTWQKVAPLYVMSKFIENNEFIMLIISITTMIGAMGGVNQTSMRKIMGYSSINHLSWIMLLMTKSKELWIVYMILYSLMMYIVCFMMKSYNIMFINQMKTFSTKLTDKISMIITIMSMGGLPPLLGFLPKMMTMSMTVKLNEIPTMVIMVISSVITLSYYLKMSSKVNLMMMTSQKWMKCMKPNIMMFIMMMILNIMFPAMMLLTFF